MKPHQLPMSISIIVCALMTPISYAAKTEQETVSVDGREVLLKDNGTWEYLSTDRYIDTKDGHRIKLQEDGKWMIVGNALLESKQQVRTSNLDIQLQKVVIETYEKKVQKNTRIKTQTVFYVDLTTSALLEGSLNIKQDDISLIDVKDNNGKSYPVLSIQSNNSKIPPDSKMALVIRVEKSPSFFDNVKSLDITFNSGIFGITKAVTLSQNTTDFNEQKVDGFR